MLIRQRPNSVTENDGRHLSTVPMRSTRPVSFFRHLLGISTGAGVGLMVAVCSVSPAFCADMSTSQASEQSMASTGPGGLMPHMSEKADVGRERISRVALDVSDWIVRSGNNDKMPFIVVDKVDAKTFVFDKNGILLGAAPALLGLAHGDDSVPGIGERKLSTIRPEERTTPAGRFVASLDTNLHGQEILWVDYDAAISLHAVVVGSPKERRAERLASPTPTDNRISYGCINVPVTFFQEIVRPAFLRTEGVVYVLPETRPARETFSVYGYQPQ